MYTELLMGALVAIASPQDVQDEKVEVRESKTIEIEIPAIEIPGFDIYVPGFEIVVPSYGWVDDWDEHRREVLKKDFKLVLEIYEAL